MDTRYGPVKLKVPAGFPVLLQRFAREVIREQPEDIAEFGATFFQTLVIERKVTGDDPLAGDPYDKPGFHTPPVKALRPISSKTRQEEIKRGQAATKIQAGYRGYRTRKTSTQNRKREQTRQQEKAATKIQAQYRGYRTRKSISQPVKKDDTETSDEEIKQRENVAVDDSAPASTCDDAKDDVAVDEPAPKLTPDDATEDVAFEKTAPKSMSDDSAGDEQPEKTDTLNDAAAIKIQATYRGYRSRKQMRETKVIQPQGTSDKETGKESQAEIIVESPAMSLAADKPSDDINDKEAVGELASEQVAESQNVTSAIDDDMKEEEVVENKNLDASQEFEQKDEKLEEIPDDKEDMEAAALKIQATFRGHQARKQLEDKNEHQDVSQDKVDDVSDAKPVEPSADDKDKSEKELTSPSDNEQSEAAALKIQSAYRGHMVRKQLKASNQNDKTERKEEKTEQPAVDSSDENLTSAPVESMDKVDDVSVAQTLIQDGEKEEKIEEKEKESEQPVMDSSDDKPTSSEKELTSHSDNEQSEAAALKIQSTYRGHMVRKQLKANNQKEKTEKKEEKAEQPTVDSVDDNLTSEATQGQVEDVETLTGHKDEVDGDEAANKETDEGNIAAGNESQNGSDQVLVVEKPQDENLHAAEKVEKTDEAISESKNEVSRDKDKERAAVKIQSNYRGYRARKQLKQ